MSFAWTAFVFADARPFTPPKGAPAVIGVALLVLAGTALVLTVVAAIRVRRLRYLYAHRPEIIEERLARARAKQRATQERGSRQQPGD